MFILISSILTWGLTKRKVCINYTKKLIKYKIIFNIFKYLKNEIPITQADYKHRICHPNFEAHYKLENYLLLLNNKVCIKFLNYISYTCIVIYFAVSWVFLWNSFSPRFSLWLW